MAKIMAAVSRIPRLVVVVQSLSTCTVRVKSIYLRFLSVTVGMTNVPWCLIAHEQLARKYFRLTDRNGSRYLLERSISAMLLCYPA